MPEHILDLSRRLADARRRYLAFHEQTDEPLEPGTAGFHEAQRLLSEIDALLNRLSLMEPKTAEGARALAAAVLAHSGELRPSVCRMMANLYVYLGGEPPSPS